MSTVLSQTNLRCIEVSEDVDSILTRKASFLIVKYRNLNYTDKCYESEENKDYLYSDERVWNVRSCAGDVPP